MIDKVSLQQIAPKASAHSVMDKQAGAIDVARTFGEYLNDALGAVQAQKQQADKLTGQFIAGEISDVHSVTIAAEKAALGLELTVQIRNKVVEAYQEIMRIQL